MCYLQQALLGRRQSSWITGRCRERVLRMLLWRGLVGEPASCPGCPEAWEHWCQSLDVLCRECPGALASLSLPQTMKLAPEAVATLTPVFTSDVDGVPPTNRNLTWSSSNPSIVSVDATTGEMTTHEEGTVTITAKTVSGAAAGSGGWHHG